MKLAWGLLLLGLACGAFGYSMVQGAGPCTLPEAFAGIGLGVIGAILGIVSIYRMRVARAGSQ